MASYIYLLIVCCFYYAVADPDVTFDFQCTQTNLTATFTVNTDDGYITGRNLSYTLNNPACAGTQNSTAAENKSESNFTLTLNLDHHADCGHLFSSTDDHIFTNNTVILRVTEFLRGGVSQRDFYYRYELSCQMERNFTVDTGTDYYVVNKTVVVTQENKNVSSYNFDLQMDLYTDNTFTSPAVGELTVDVNEKVHVQIKEQDSTPEYHFVVNRCQVQDNLSSPSAVDAFFDNKCSQDPTFSILSSDTDNNTFSFEFQAFYFTPGSVPTEDMYLKCFVFVCHKSFNVEQCKQECNQARKRRDVSDQSENNDAVKELSVVSKVIRFNTEKTCSDVVCPSNSKCYELAPARCICDEGYVFSRFGERCVSERITQIDRVHLGLEFDQAYLDTSSPEFLALATKYEDVLYKSFLAAGTTKDIEGVKVIKAYKGSVILEVQIIYAKSSSPTQAYKAFVSSLKAETRVATTVRKQLKFLDDDKEPEIVEIQKKMADIQMLTLIIVVVVVLLIVLLSVVVILVVRRRRSNKQPVVGVVGVDNNGIVLEKI